MKFVEGQTVGIDLGTSYSALSRLGEDGNPEEPHPAPYRRATQIRGGARPAAFKGPGIRYELVGIFLDCNRPFPATAHPIAPGAGREPQLGAAGAVENQRVRAAASVAGEFDRQWQHWGSAIPLEDRGSSLLHHLPDQVNPASGQITAAQEPGHRGGHQPTITLFAAAAAKTPTPQSVDAHHHSADASGIAPYQGRSDSPPAARLDGEPNPVLRARGEIEERGSGGE